MKKKTRESEIIVPKGYDLLDLIDTDDSGYGFDDEAVYVDEEVRINVEREREE